MSRWKGIVKKWAMCLYFSEIVIHDRLRAVSSLSKLRLARQSNRFGRACRSLRLWPSSFLQKTGEHGAGASRKKPLDPINAVSVRADEHAVLICQNAFDDHARGFFRRYQRYFFEILFNFPASRRSYAASGACAMRDRRGNTSRMHCHYFNSAVSPQLFPQRLTKSVDRKFAGSIRGLSWRPDQPENTG
jgi:hypothetical protein